MCFNLHLHVVAVGIQDRFEDNGEGSPDKQRYNGVMDLRKDTTVQALLPFWASPSGLFGRAEISFVLSYSHSFTS